MQTSSKSEPVGHPKVTRARSVRLVAGFDLLESLRSRKALVFLALYLLGSVAASGIFVRILTAVRERLEEQVGHAVNMQQLMTSHGVTRLLGALAGDPAIARSIVATPAMALFYGWLAMHFVPLLVLFTSSDAISGDIASGAARFSLFRVDRLSFALGKLIGQTCLMAVGVLVGAVACWTVGLVWLDHLQVIQTGYWLMRVSGRAIVYSFAYLGMVLCASQLAQTNARAGGLALLILFACWLSGAVLSSEPIQERAPILAGALVKLFPSGHYLALWHPSLVRSGTAMLWLIGIGLAFFAVGFWRLSTRDA